MSRLRTFVQFSRVERSLLILSVLLLPLIALGLSRLGFKRVQSILEKTSARPDQQSGTLSQARNTARMVDLAALRGLHRANCLEKSLMLWWLLRRQGIASHLRIGVRKDAAKLSAHAWIEYEGQVLNDRQDIGDRFAPFPGDFAVDLIRRS